MSSICGMCNSVSDVNNSCNCSGELQAETSIDTNKKQSTAEYILAEKNRSKDGNQYKDILINLLKNTQGMN
jgi:hypothetical protein